MNNDKTKTTDRRIKFDVMLRDRFVSTLRMPITFDIIVDYHGDQPVLDYRAFSRYVEQQRPSLAGQPYQILF